MKRLLFLVAAIFIFLPAMAQAEDTNQVRVHFLDVGQADSILIQTSDGKNVLIDGGTNYAADGIVSYLKKQGVKRIDMLIATHSHHDHIGAMDKLINTFQVNMLYIPPLSHQTRSYRDLKKAVDQNKTTVMDAKTGQSIRLAKDVRLDMLAPLANHYKNENNHSLVTKLTHGENRFLLMADAGEKSEKQMLQKHTNVKADVLKVGHHGGNSSTTDEFLAKVDPKYAILTVGNHANFPSQEVLDRLKRKNVTTLSTHQLGTIVAVSNGKAIVFHMRKNSER